MKLYKLIIGCCLLLLGTMHLAEAQMPGTPYLTGKKAKVTCVIPTGLNVANSSPTITAGGTSTFTLSGTNVSGATWAITPSAGVSTASGTGSSTGAITFATAGTYTVTFTANSTGNCTTTTATAISTESVGASVCPTPTGLNVARSSAASISTGTTSTFTLSGTNVSSATWAIAPTTGVSTASGTGLTTGAITFSTAGTYTITFTASSTGSCTTTTATANNSVTVTVPACATPTGLSVSNSASTISTGGSSTFGLSGTNVSSATWAITPTTGVSTASGSGTSTGAITFSTSGTYTVTFTASSTGSCTTTTATATTTETVNPAAVVTTLSCASATQTGTLAAGTAASGVTKSVPYTGGNGGNYSAYSISSTGVTGLTATASAGSIASGSGSIVFNITGTPSAAGTASFALSLGSQSCSFTATVIAAPTAVTCYPRYVPFIYTSGSNTVIGTITRDGTTITSSSNVTLPPPNTNSASNCFDNGTPDTDQSYAYKSNTSSSSTYIITFSVPINNVDFRLDFGVDNINSYTLGNVTLNTSSNGITYTAPTFTRLGGCTWTIGAGGVMTPSTPGLRPSSTILAGSQTFYRISSATNFTQIKITIPYIPPTSSNTNIISVVMALCEMTF